MRFQQILWSWKICLASAATLGCFISMSAEEIKLNYPESPKVTQVDEYFGTEVPDPYRWLEDPDSDQTREWVKNQSAFARSYLDQLPHRDTIQKRVTDLWNYEKFGVPFARGSRIFFFRNSGLQNQSVLYYRDQPGSEPVELIDPNKLSKDGTIALSSVSVSHDGAYLAYAISRSGSDWKEWKVREVESGKDLDDHIKWSKFSSASWSADNAGFYYSRYDEPNEGDEFEAVNYFQKLYFHKIGTPQSEDNLIFHDPDNKEWGFDGSESEDGKYLIISIWKGTDRRNQLYFKDLESPDSSVIRLIHSFEAEYAFIGNDGTKFWFRTDLDAPKSRVIEIDTLNPDKVEIKELIPEQDFTLTSVSAVGGRFITHYLKDAKSVIEIYQTNGDHIQSLKLPGIGSISGFGGKFSQKQTYYSFTSFNTPGSVFKLDIPSLTSTPFFIPELKFNPDDYVTRQVFYSSKDGTRIPMFISHRKDMDFSSPRPAYLYGYGGFNISLPPRFSVSNLAWMEMGGIYAQANLRGGGEYGETWHKAGTKLQKQNVFDDFIGAAEYLIENKMTSSKQLTIGGGSNGGLLVGACANQRPNLYAVALPAVGVMDMLRFQKFTIGWAWTSDYGSAEHSKEEFDALYAYSPYHNLKPGTKYPSVMVTTADHDDRVVPAHSFKYAARLQECHAGANPAIIRIESKAGHGAGKPTQKIIEEVADKWAFVFSQIPDSPTWKSDQ